MNEHGEDFNKELENIKKNPADLKHIIVLFQKSLLLKNMCSLTFV